MSFLKRLFSADYRAAVTAEAAGHLEQAAEHYALAGEHAEAARVHLTRARRADSRADKVSALRDALHWTAPESAIGPRIYKELGRALLDQLRAEGALTEPDKVTQRDRERVREAAEMLMRGGDFRAAGEAYESIGDTQAAARAYRRGGLVDRMEMALTADEARIEQERALRDGFANYEMYMRIGDRDAAREALRGCVQLADNKSDYRRLLDDLESRLITAGPVVLRMRQHPGITAFAGEIVAMGRDNLCELPLRTGGVSRRHAEITVGAPGAEPRFHLRDAGSRNGTFIGGMPLSGAVPLVGEGSFSLGEHCTIEYSVVPAAGEQRKNPQLILRVASGMDRDRVLVAAGADERVDLGRVMPVAIAIEFRRGRPFLDRGDAGTRLELGAEPIAHGQVQLIHGDQLVIDGTEVDVS